MLNFFVRPPNIPAELLMRLRRVERRLDLVLNHLGVAFEEEAEELPENVRALADGGDKIGAIKEYRNATGVGLAEAKQVVENYLRT